MPVNFKILTTNVLEIEAELEEAKKESQKYSDLVKLLEQLLENGKQIAEFKSAYPETEAPVGHQFPDHTPIRKREGKTNNEVYEEIILAFGKPMHVTDILDAARAAGVRQKGTAAPLNQLRNVLNGAKTRFYNVGNNHWWIVGRPLPEEERPPSNSRQTSNSHQPDWPEVAVLPASCES